MYASLARAMQAEVRTRDKCSDVIKPFTRCWRMLSSNHNNVIFIGWAEYFLVTVTFTVQMR